LDGRRRGNSRARSRLVERGDSIMSDVRWQNERGGSVRKNASGGKGRIPDRPRKLQKKKWCLDHCDRLIDGRSRAQTAKGVGSRGRGEVKRFARPTDEKGIAAIPRGIFGGKAEKARGRRQGKKGGHPGGGSGPRDFYHASCDTLRITETWKKSETDKCERPLNRRRCFLVVNKPDNVEKGLKKLVPQNLYHILGQFQGSRRNSPSPNKAGQAAAEKKKNLRKRRCRAPKKALHRHEGENAFFCKSHPPPKKTPERGRKGAAIQSLDSRKTVFVLGGTDPTFEQISSAEGEE